MNSAPVLAVPVPEDEYELGVDANTHTFLQQFQDGKLRIIWYVIRLFNATRSTRQEVVAVVFGLKHFRHCVLVRKVMVRSALSSLRCTKDPLGSRRVGWISSKSSMIESNTDRVLHTVLLTTSLRRIRAMVAM